MKNRVLDELEEYIKVTLNEFELRKNDLGVDTAIKALNTQSVVLEKYRNGEKDLFNIILKMIDYASKGKIFYLNESGGKYCEIKLIL